MVEGIGKCNRVRRMAREQETKEDTGLEKTHQLPAQYHSLRWGTGNCYHGYGRGSSFFQCPWCSVLFPIKWGYWNWHLTVLVRMRYSLSDAYSTSPGTKDLYTGYSQNDSVMVSCNKCLTGIYVKGGRDREKTLNIEKVSHHRNSSFPILFLKAPQLSHLGCVLP